jgi:hypothetical protein
MPPSLDPEIVHALSNHLSVILGFVEIVIADLPEDHPHYRDLVEVRDAALAAAELIGRGREKTDGDGKNP